MLKVKIFLGHCITTLLVFDYHDFKEFLFSILQSRNVGVKSVGAIKYTFDKNGLLHDGLSI